MNTEQYRPDVDGLRGLAVIAVILGHFWPNIFQSAYLGVDVFFVISGYVITSSIQKYKSEKISSFLLVFFAKRIKRLLPALLFCVATVSVLSLLLIPNATVSLITGFTAVIGISNLYLMYSSADYFGESVEYNLFTHTWSLGVEEQFYLLYPALFWLTISFIKNGSFRKNLLVSGLIISLIGFIIFSLKQPVTSYYFPLFRAWEFLVGVSVFFLRRPESGNSRNYLTVISILLVIAFLLPKSEFITTIFVVALAALIIHFSNAGHKVFKLLTSKILLWIGLRSYSLYLWHWPILVLIKLTVGVSTEWLLMAMVLTFWISSISYNYVETRFRYAKVSPIKTYKVGLVSVLSVMMLLVLSAKPLSGRLLVVDNYTGNKPVHSQLTCHSGDLFKCLDKGDNNTNTVFVIGDSHATNFVPSLKKVSEINGYAFRYYGGIEFIRTIFNEPECETFRCIEDDLEKITQSFEKSIPGDIVFFSMSRNRLYLPEYYDYQGISRRGLENKAGINLLNESIKVLANFFRERNIQFILVDDIPATCAVGDYLRVNYDINACSLSYIESMDDRKPLTQAYGKVIESYPSIGYLDPHLTLCNESSCELIIDDKPLYSDTSPHITEVSKYVLTDFFDEFFSSLPLEK